MITQLIANHMMKRRNMRMMKIMAVLLMKERI